GRSCQNVQTLRQRLHLSAGDLLGSAQRLLGALTFSYIDNSAHEVHQVTGLITNRMTDRVNVFQGAARVNNSIVRFEVRFLGNRFSEQFSDSVLVLRAKAAKEFFEPRRPGLWIETKHAISFLRPISDFTGGGRPR